MRRLSSATLALICLVSLACHDADDYSPTAPAYQEALTLSAAQPNLPADGFSTLAITAKIDPGADAANRIVVFECSCTLVEGASPLERSVDASGRAEVTLRASQQPGSVQVRAKIKAKPEVAASVTIEQTLPNLDDTLTVSAAQTTALADGASQTSIFADVNTKVPAANREVKFVATRSRFLQSADGGKSATVTPDQSGRARVDLVSDATPGTIRVSATVFNVSREIAVELVLAQPETIDVQPDKQTIKATSTADGTTTLVINMRRAIGNASAGITPIVTAVDAATGTQIPVLVRNVTATSASGTAQAIVIAGPTTFRGVATIEVRVNGSEVVGKANIEIVS